MEITFPIAAVVLLLFIKSQNSFYYAIQSISWILPDYLIPDFDHRVPIISLKLQGPSYEILEQDIER